MTKTLKRRFIVFSMTAVTCLLVFIVLAINSILRIVSVLHIGTGKL